MHQPRCIECISSSDTRSTTHAVAPRLAIARSEDQIERGVVRLLVAVARMTAPSRRAVAGDPAGPTADASDVERVAATWS